MHSDCALERASPDSPAVCLLHIDILLSGLAGAGGQARLHERLALVAGLAFGLDVARLHFFLLRVGAAAGAWGSGGCGGRRRLRSRRRGGVGGKRRRGGGHCTCRHQYQHFVHGILQMTGARVALRACLAVLALPCLLGSDTRRFEKKSTASWGAPNARNNEFADRPGSSVASAPSCAAAAVVAQWRPSRHQVCNILF